MITGLSETIAGQTSSRAFQFDANGRLVGVTEGASSTTYAYDGQGNRLSVTRGAQEVYSYDAQDRLLQRGSTSYAYAPDGWLQTKTNGTAVTRYAYDLFGNLRSADLPNGKHLTYIDDGGQRRIGKRVDGVLVQGFLVDSLGRVVAELDGQGAVVSRFVYATRGHVPDYLLRGGATYRIFTDTVGSPRLIVDTATCAVAQRLAYDEFGRVLADSNPGFQPFGFAGGLYDRDTGLVRFGARDYDPEIGRWTAKDPLGFEGGDSNLYAYANNSPIQFIDPSGLSFLGSLSDFSAGFGDTLTFGATRWIRQKLGVDDVVNPCSGWYTAGEITGEVVGAIATSGIGSEAKGAAKAASSGFCFAAGTEVRTPEGARRSKTSNPATWSGRTTKRPARPPNSGSPRRSSRRINRSSR
jgi:RHS repeat-associated protein